MRGELLSTRQLLSRWLSRFPRASKPNQLFFSSSPPLKDRMPASCCKDACLCQMLEVPRVLRILSSYISSCPQLGCWKLLICLACRQVPLSLRCSPIWFTFETLTTTRMSKQLAKHLLPLRGAVRNQGAAIKLPTQGVGVQNSPPRELSNNVVLNSSSQDKRSSVEKGATFSGHAVSRNSFSCLGYYSDR